MELEHGEATSRAWRTAAAWRRALVCALLAVALAFTAHSLRFGVDTLDTAVYLAIPYRFLLGDQPFVDEINPIQTAGLIALPLVRCLHAWLGGTEGIVLASRIAGLAIELATASAVWLYLRRRLGVTLAAVIAFGGVVLVLRMPVLSYSWFAAQSFCAGLFLGAYALETRRERLWLVVGALHALTIVALSTFVFAVVAFACLAVAREREHRWRRLGAYAAGGCLLALLFVPAFLDLSSLTTDYAFAHARTMGTITRKLRVLPPYAWSQVPNHGWVVASVLVVALGSLRRARWLVVLAVSVLPLVLHGPLMSWSSLWTCTLLALFAPLLAWPARDDPFVRSLMHGIWWPAVLAGSALTLSSSTYVLVAGYGMIPAAIVTVVLSARFTWRTCAPVWPAAAPYAALVAPVCLCAVLVADQRCHFNDAPRDQLDTRVESGPYRGLNTTREQAELIANLQHDLAVFEDERQRVLFYYVFPAGYLMTRMRPAADSAWGITCLPERRMYLCGDAFERNFARCGVDGVVVVKLRVFHDPVCGWRNADSGLPDDVVDARCRVVVETPQYAISVSR